MEVMQKGLDGVVEFWWIPALVSLVCAIVIALFHWKQRQQQKSFIAVSAGCLAAIVLIFYLTGILSGMVAIASWLYKDFHGGR